MSNGLKSLRLPEAKLISPTRIRRVEPPGPEAKDRRYQAILASIQELGLVEPLLVCPLAEEEGQYLLVDGHLRLQALMELGQTEVFCLVIDEARISGSANSRSPQAGQKGVPHA